MQAQYLLNESAALLLVDIQNDFMPGGALAVTNGDEILSPLNKLMAAFAGQALPIVATRDWHPADHCSFTAQGGIWPSHCVAGTSGAGFHPGIMLPKNAHIVSKAEQQFRDAYSGFDNTQLDSWLAERGIQGLLVGGLATDYCVLHTVLDGLQAGFRVTVLTDAIRAVNLKTGDGAQAIARMASAGAQPATSARVLRAIPAA